MCDKCQPFPKNLLSNAKFSRVLIKDFTLKCADVIQCLCEEHYANYLRIYKHDLSSMSYNKKCQKNML